jgi:hypothetical protein
MLDALIELLYLHIYHPKLHSSTINSDILPIDILSIDK